MPPCKNVHVLEDNLKIIEQGDRKDASVQLQNYIVLIKVFIMTRPVSTQHRWGNLTNPHP